MAAPIRSRRKHVLVVEDSPIIRRLIEVCLRPMNLDLTLVPNDPQCLESAVIRPPDAIVLDIGLPGIEGWEVLAGILNAERTRGVPVLMLTGHGESFFETDAEARGAASFMTKPFLPDALRAAISDLLEAA